MVRVAGAEQSRHFRNSSRRLSFFADIHTSARAGVWALEWECAAKSENRHRSERENPQENDKNLRTYAPTHLMWFPLDGWQSHIYVRYRTHKKLIKGLNVMYHIELAFYQSDLLDEECRWIVRLFKNTVTHVCKEQIDSRESESRGIRETTPNWSVGWIAYEILTKPAQDGSKTQIMYHLIRITN